jgi:hypothetical protein
MNCESGGKMKRQVFVGLGLVVALVSWAGSGIQAQGASQDDKAKTKSVTGCLAKGADATTFTLSDAMPATASNEQSKEAAKSSEARSYLVVAKDTSLKLADHVGHKVTLTGTIEESAAAAPKPGAPEPAGTSGKGGAMPNLSVTALKMVAPTCTP